MLTGSRIITCHVTMEHTPPLPSGFNINGYLIRSLKQTDSLCHVYYASDADHVQYLPVSYTHLTLPTILLV